MCKFRCSSDGGRGCIYVEPRERILLFYRFHLNIYVISAGLMSSNLGDEEIMCSHVDVCVDRHLIEAWGRTLVDELIII